jgi:hypothetical protein
MNTIQPLTGPHLRTYNAIFQHPVSHNLGWHDVYAMFRELGLVEEEPNGNLKVTRNGQTIVLHRSRTKDVSNVEEIMSLRHFLERSGAASPESNETEAYWLLVIDHHEARIFRSEMHDSIPQRIWPRQLEDYSRHAHNLKVLPKGMNSPDPKGFFEPVAKALQGDGQILVMGCGAGASNESDQFIAWANAHHPDLAIRIIGMRVVNENHLTEAQLLALAREFYANATLSADGAHDVYRNRVE